MHGTTQVWELRDGSIEHYELTPEELGISRHDLADLAGGDGTENAQALRAVFAGTGSPAHHDAIAATAGAMFYLNGTTDSIADGVAHASKLIADGSVAAWLKKHEEANYGSADRA